MGVTLQYAERGHGKGNVVTFLHGYTDFWLSFSSVIENLPDRFHAYAITQRGHGDSDKPEVASEYEIDSFVNDFIYSFQASTFYNPLEEEFLNKEVMESQKGACVCLESCFNRIS